MEQLVADNNVDLYYGGHVFPAVAHAWSQGGVLLP
jgi:hypothetical protein